LAEVVSFEIEGDFAAFPDPSVTSNKTTYTIPSKSAVIGLIGAMIGVRRPNTFDMLYCDGMLELFKSTRIGVKVLWEPKKVSFYTNHVSLKESKTKPFKVELLSSPKYLIYVKSTHDVIERLSDALESHEFVYSPTLGHAYCPARITSYSRYASADSVLPDGKCTSTVLLDERADTGSRSSYELDLASNENRSKVIIERHLHHYFCDDQLDKRVLRHWIPMPVGGQESKVIIEHFYPTTTSLTEFVALNGDENIVCLF